MCVKLYNVTVSIAQMVIIELRSQSTANNRNEDSSLIQRTSEHGVSGENRGDPRVSNCMALKQMRVGKTVVIRESPTVWLLNRCEWGKPW
jgi:hypothetical protein